MKDKVSDKLIVGLDVANVKKATQLVEILSPVVNFYKIGHQLVFTGGLELARELVEDGKKVFLDLKLLDIDNTIYKTIENILKLNINMLTIHAYPKAMRAAVAASKNSNLCLLGVTVLTSMDNNDLNEAGYDISTKDLVIKRCMQAKEIGMGGVVASAYEAPIIKNIIGEKMALVTPGIRLACTDKGDQKRVVSPQHAIKAGASHLVISRPIIEADFPLENAVAILDKIEQSLKNN